MTIAITGASGSLGRAACAYVLRVVPAQELRVTTRHPGSLQDLADRGVDVRYADFGDPSSLRSALGGVERMLIISTNSVGARLQHHRTAISAAASVGVGHVIYTSVPRPVTENPALVVPDHAGTEQALRDSGLVWTCLRNNLYADLQVPVVAQAAATGRLVSNSGNGATAFVTRDDCAAAAAAVLIQGNLANEAIDVTGPAALTCTDLAELASVIRESSVDVIDVDDEHYRAGLAAAGLPAAAVDVVTSFGAATRAGFFAQVTDTVRNLTGRGPTSLAELVSNATGGG